MSHAPFPALVAVAALIGCATPKLDSDGALPAEARVEPLVDSSGAAAAVTLDPRGAYPTEPGAEVWRIVEGRNVGSVQRRERVKDDRFGATVAVRLGERRTQYWTVVDGEVAMVATHAHADGAISLFEPPLTLAPASLSPGEPSEAQVRMTVVDENDTTRVRQRGTATRRMAWIDDVDLRLGDRTYRAHRIETHFLADLDLARAEERATLLLVPELGFVSEDRVETIRAAGIFGRTVRQSLRRDDIGLAPSAD